MKTDLFRMTAALSLVLCASRGELARGAGPGVGTYARGACTRSEAWELSEDLPQRTRERFRQSLAEPVAILAFSEALALRKSSTRSAELRMLGEYAISRALDRAELPHIAFEGFVAIASRPITSETAGIQYAALDCLLRIQQRYPSFGIPSSIGKHLNEFALYTRTPGARETLWTAAGEWIRQTALQDPGRASEPTLELLEGSGTHESLARGLLAARAFRWKEAIAHLQKWSAAAAAGNIPESQRRFEDPVRLLLARSHFAIGETAQASEDLKKVRKSSNELTAALTELAWSQLAAGNHAEAIGAAMNLQAGGLRHTFSPESPMVMAMALNELCQYPESIRAAKLFRSAYETSFRWLSSRDRKAPLYPTAVEFLRNRKVRVVPERVATEWVRSPVFIASQDEINLLFDEKKSARGLARQGSEQQVKLAQELLESLRVLREGDAPALAQIRAQYARLQRLQRAAPTWKSILGHHVDRARSLQAGLLARINEALDSRSEMMLAQLEEIAENLQLVEVEIYNGASADIIWQNAHPEYAALAKQWKDEPGSALAPSKVWNWGRMAAISDEATEIWEDELGSFKANLFDNCSSKDKYLSIQRASR